MKRHDLFFLLAMFSAAVPAQAQTTAPAPAKMDADECNVWNRELTFAQSVEKHDAKAFAAHLHSGTVFSAGTAEPVRGPKAVLAEWAPLIEGKTLQIRWHPDVVNIGGDRNVAFSRGPYMVEDTRANAAVKFKVGSFMTVWVRKSPKSEWLVLFDGGGAAATPVDNLQAAEKFMSQAASSCPAR